MPGRPPIGPHRLMTPNRPQVMNSSSATVSTTHVTLSSPVAGPRTAPAWAGAALTVTSSTLVVALPVFVLVSVGAAGSIGTLAARRPVGEQS
jgi:hypothetical protein